MIIFLYGKDTFRSRRQLRQMVEKFKKDRDPQGLNLAHFNATKHKPGQILEQILASPFLSEKRMVVVEELLSSKEKDFVSELLIRIENNNIPESTVLVFWEPTDTFKTKAAKDLFQRLQQEKFAQQYELLSGSTLTTWVHSEIEKNKRKIQRNAVEYIVQHVGNDMWHLHSLIDQLSAYADQDITIEDVQLFLDEQADDNIFNLVDAIINKQPKQVYQMIQQQYKMGEDSQFIFAMLLRQFRILLELKDLQERKMFTTAEKVAKDLGIHPFVVKKSIPMLQKYSMSKLEEIYEQLLLLDKKTKTGFANQSLLVDVFVGSVATSPK